jgi:hypothetical protein
MNKLVFMVVAPSTIWRHYAHGVSLPLWMSVVGPYKSWQFHQNKHVCCSTQLKETTLSIRWVVTEWNKIWIVCIELEWGSSKNSVLSPPRKMVPMCKFNKCKHSFSLKLESKKKVVAKVSVHITNPTHPSQVFRPSSITVQTSEADFWNKTLFGTWKARPKLARLH